MRRTGEHTKDFAKRLHVPNWIAFSTFELDVTPDCLTE